MLHHADVFSLRNLCVSTAEQSWMWLSGGMWTGVGQSGIHGWGLFALVDMKADSMVAEYRGELVRPTVANVKEKRYRAAGMDCYLFAISDRWVIDATRAGTIARFTVGLTLRCIPPSSALFLSPSPSCLLGKQTRLEACLRQIIVLVRQTQGSDVRMRTQRLPQAPVSVCECGLVLSDALHMERTCLAHPLCKFRNHERTVLKYVTFE